MNIQIYLYQENYMNENLNISVSKNIYEQMSEQIFVSKIFEYLNIQIYLSHSALGICGAFRCFGPWAPSARQAHIRSGARLPWFAENLVTNGTKAQERASDNIFLQKGHQSLHILSITEELTKTLKAIITNKWHSIPIYTSTLGDIIGSASFSW